MYLGKRNLRGSNFCEWSLLLNIYIKRALRFVLDNYTSSYEILLEKLGKPTMNLARERLLCIEVYKTLNSLNRCFMQELFKLTESNRNVRNKYKLNLNDPVVNQVNSLPHHVKFAENLETFKKPLSYIY